MSSGPPSPSVGNVSFINDNIQNIECVNYLIDNAKHLSNHDDQMLAKTVKRLLVPVASTIDVSNSSRVSSVPDRATGDSGIDKEPRSLLPVHGYDTPGEDKNETPSVLPMTASIASRDGTEPRSSAHRDVPGTLLDSSVVHGPSVLGMHSTNERNHDIEPSSCRHYHVQPHEIIEDLNDSVDVDDQQHNNVLVDNEPSSVSSVSLSVQCEGTAASIVELREVHPFQGIRSMVGNIKIGYCGVYRDCKYTDFKNVMRNLLNNCNNASFGKQSLVSFIESDVGGRSTRKNEIPHFHELTGIYSVEQNPNGQIYLQQDLARVGHCTAITRSLFKNILIKRNLFDSNFKHSESYQSSVQHGIPFCHVPNDCNYLSLDRKFMVINNDELVKDEKILINQTMPISQTTAMITSMFGMGLGDYFDFDNNKRSSTSLSSKRKNGNLDTSGSKKKAIKMRVSSVHEAEHVVTIDPNALPVLSFGWKTSNCNKYGNHPSTIAGTIRPFLRNAELPPEILNKVVELVQYVMSTIPAEHVFNVEKIDDPLERKYRSEGMKELRDFLGGDERSDLFNVEGFTFLIPSSVGFHKDTLNCTKEGMKSVLSVNARIRFNQSTFPSGTDTKLAKWLLLNEYDEWFPCSLICYSREKQGNYCKKLADHDRFMQKDLVRKCVGNALVNHVGDVTDYRTRVWNNKNFPRIFRKKAKIRGSPKSRQFKSKSLATPASYDKMCHYSIILHIWLDLHINFKHFTVATTIDYICFAAFQCNGTTVLAEIHRNLLSDQNRWYDKYLEYDSFYSFLCYVHTEVLPDTEIGSCNDPRSTYSAGSNSTDWSEHRQDLLTLFQKFHIDPDIRSSRSRMQAVMKEVANELCTKKDSSTKKAFYCGAGDFSSNVFLQLASATGLIPLYCMTSAELGNSKSLGPAKLIREGVNSGFTAKEVNDFFRDMHKDITKIWGSLITLAILENMLCELWRSFTKSKQEYKKQNGGQRFEGDIPIDIITNRKYRRHSDKVDLIFFDERRNTVLNMFILRVNGTSGTTVRPELLMKHAQLWERGNRECNITITNWCRDKHDSENLFWKKTGLEMTLETELDCKEEVKQLMGLQH